MSTQQMTGPTAIASARAVRRRPRFLLLLVATAAFGLGACTPGASGVPSVPNVSIPTTDPNATPITGCVDAATMAVIDQLTADGADVPTLLADNKDVLILGLNTLQPADAATTTWRDELVDALESGDLETAAEKVDELVSGGVTLTAC
jgi:hypothetical protein